MARYVTLIQFTEKGAKDIKKSTSRARAFDKAAAKAGVTIEGQYWTFGRYDGVLILSADDQAKVLQCLLGLAALGYVKTETLVALNEGEFDGVVPR